MKLNIDRDELLKPLQQVIGAVEKRQTLPALSNVLIRATEDGISLTATDLELELVAATKVHVDQAGAVSVSARKLLDICRNLPEQAPVHLEDQGERLVLSSGGSRFSLATLPAAEFPALEKFNAQATFSVEQNRLRKLIDKTAFAMAQQDVRYYLNGLLLEMDENTLRAVATDGHRLALCQTEALSTTEEKQQVIVPRKAITELLRLIPDASDAITIQLDPSHVRIDFDGLTFTSKLIDGRFPEYGRVIPQDGDKSLTADKQTLRQALIRASILSNEKYRGVRFSLSEDNLNIEADNPDQERADESIPVEYNAPAVDIAFNVTYLLDVINVIDGDNFNATLKDANSSCLVTTLGDVEAKYVVMPMRL